MFHNLLTGFFKDILIVRNKKMLLISLSMGLFFGGCLTPLGKK